MTQQVIDIGSAPDDATGDPLRTSFDKTNKNFTELYMKGANEGIWNYNQTTTDTSTSPVSGRFRTNSGNYHDATQIAIHAITIQGIDRTSTLRTLLVGDLVQCQDSTNPAAWCRYSLQSLPVDHGTWFQLNVTLQADSGVASGDNQEIVFVFTANSGGGGGGAYQPLDPTLTSLSDLVGAANTFPYFATADTFALDVVTPFARGSILSAVNAGDARGKIGAAPLDSPALTGNPTAPTPTAGDNDTSVATTAFVTTAIAGKADTSALTAKADLASPTFTGDPHAPTPTAGDNDTSVATTAFVAAAIAAIPAPTSTSATPPQGRLTLQTATPVMTTTQAAKTTIFYTPYVGNLVPIYDGTNFSMVAFSELSVLTTDTTKSPAAIGVSKVNDWFVWNDAGTIRVGHGPDWTSDTTRSAGTALTRVNGIWLNAVAITNGPAAQRGTYVGTTRSNASSQLDWIYGSLAVNWGAGFLGVWNAYNRVNVATRTADSTDNWTYATPIWRAANGNATARISFVIGLEEDAIDAVYYGAASGSSAQLGVGLDSTTAFFGTAAWSSSSIAIAISASYRGTVGVGFHYVSPIEYNFSGTSTFYGDASLPLVIQTGFYLTVRM